MKIRGHIVCPTCKNDTFRLVVPDDKMHVIISFSECTMCGEWMRQFTDANIKPVSPKKETT
jgi:Zn ribbon nucleic-acid-binding protein